MRTVTIGAPSLTGKDANDLVKEVFESAKFPLAVVVTNHMPRQVVFPVVGVFLNHVCDADNASATVKIESYDQLQTFATDVEQIAELNRYEKAITVDEVIKGAKPKAGSKSAKVEDVAQNASNTEGGAAQPEGENPPPAE